MLRAVADDNLRWFVIDSVFDQELVGDRLAKFRNTGTRGVLRESGFQRRNGGRFNVLGSVEVRLACSEAANVDSLGFHRLRLAVDRKRERRS
jgi:hypothetical protein